MKIADAAVTLHSTHFASSHSEQNETLRVWQGEQPQANQTATPDSAVAHISAAARSAQATDAIQQAADAADNDPFLQLVKAVVEWLTGKTIDTFHASSMPSAAVSEAPAPTETPTAPPPPSARGGATYDYHAVHEETENTGFSAEGTVKTTDGRSIAFHIDLAMSRQQIEHTDISLRAGDAKRRDPLVINFGGTAAQLSDQHFRFDLAGSGQATDVPLLGQGSGYLALDLNGNGRVDSGAELFGPASGSGFGELARYDSDGNGWIDESDPIFDRLRIWTPAAEGNGDLTTLKERNVGALYLGRSATPFELRGAQGADLGAIRESGIYLTADGGTGTLQEVDLTV